jgi:RNA polymerase sigma-70 factor (ECF subfamily)
VTAEKWAAEDLTQEAFLKVWQSAHRYRAQRGSVRTWILSVVRNQGVDQLRARASRRRTLEKVEVSAPSYEPSEAFAQVWHEARLGQVSEGLDALPHVQQQVLELAHFSGLTHMEIAERLHLPLGTVKGRMRLGLGKLRNNREVRLLVDPLLLDGPVPRPTVRQRHPQRLAKRPFAALPELLGLRQSGRGPSGLRPSPWYT